MFELDQTAAILKNGNHFLREPPYGHLHQFWWVLISQFERFA